jgi:16S rRNA (guanine966-N2)-methyltransferase
MRIIAGTLKGHQFNSPKGHKTHPMGDRVRTALFNTLGDITGLTVLDAFSGSGALCFESVSRGAKSALALELDYDAYQVIVENTQKLGLTDQIKVMHINARSWTYRNNTERFDLVFCDPPYNQIQETTLEKMAKHAEIGGLVVYSLPPHGDIRLPPEKYELITTKTYGDAMLAFYRKIS